MTRVDPGMLRLELLRTRAAIERAELRAAVIDLRNATAPLRSVIGLVSGHAAGGERREGVSAIVRTVIRLVRERPWVLSAVATLASRRGVRRWLVLGAVTALVAVVVRRVVAQPAPRPEETETAQEPARE